MGHLQAFKYPDYSYEQWKYRDYQGHDILPRKNSEEFLKPAEAIFRKLAEINPERSGNVDAGWKENAPGIRGLFEMTAPKSRGKNELDERCENWIAKYEHLFKSKEGSTKYRYDNREWRDRAMELARRNNLAEFIQTDWARFQRAALKQRFFVLERMM